jgi:hypothetical protein
MLNLFMVLLIIIIKVEILDLILLFHGVSLTHWFGFKITYFFGDLLDGECFKI